MVKHKVGNPNCTADVYRARLVPLHGRDLENVDKFLSEHRLVSKITRSHNLQAPQITLFYH